ncbi:MAG: ATP-dependent DNA helicase DinG [Candidatus Poriferisodalaceae bacterium]|jgi:ATP-dependent DNA helicase DinG
MTADSPETWTATKLLRGVVTNLPGGGEVRIGQELMSDAVARSIAHRRPLAVQAGTGTGKSLAYLVPAIESGDTVVIATATKALQDQLANKDLPFLSQHLAEPFVYSVLKGRSNYVCRQRLEEIKSGADQMELPTDDATTRLGKQVKDLLEWADSTVTGDRAELSFEPDGRVWSSVSVTSEECPGAANCPSGATCFAEDAKAAAAASSVIVVNLHLYSIDLLTNGGVLPEHDVVIIDEAHQLEDVISSVAGIELGGGRFGAHARNARRLIAGDSEATAVAEIGTRLAEILGPLRNKRLTSIDGELDEALALARSRVERLSAVVRAADTTGGDEHQAYLRVIGGLGSLLEEIDLVRTLPKTHVAWVEGMDNAPILRTAPIDVGSFLAEHLWDRRGVVLTSATLPEDLPARLGLEEGEFDYLDVGSPFDYEEQAMLYCALHMPDPRSDGYRNAVVAELADLINAAGGRTLGLFTSWRALEETAEGLADLIDHPILTQRDLPKQALVDAFIEDESTVLLATMGFWQGVDIPGRTLSLVTIDRIPFPRPDEPLLQARRELAGSGAFGVVDLPRAAMLLAQGAGRLIRSETDRGVVAVLDPRLGKANYRWKLVKSLPPMKRTRHHDEAVEFLKTLAASGERELGATSDADDLAD